MSANKIQDQNVTVPKKKHKKPKEKVASTKKSKKTIQTHTKYNFWRRWKIALTNLLEMFLARGYHTEPHFIRQLSHDDFKEVVKAKWIPNLGFLLSIPKPNGLQTTKVCFYRSESVGTNDMRTILKHVTPSRHVVVVVDVASKPALEKMVKDVKIEIFTLNQLSFNLLKHKLVPPHRLLRAHEIEALLQKYKLPSVHVLNKMLVTDPVARYYGVGVGHVFEITRPTPEGHSFKTWRVVCNVPLK